MPRKTRVRPVIGEGGGDQSLEDELGVEAKADKKIQETETDAILERRQKKGREKSRRGKEKRAIEQACGENVEERKRLKRS